MLLRLTGLLVLAIHYSHAIVHFSKRLDGFTYKTIYGVRFDKCQRHCESRERCRSVNYLRSHHACFLNSETRLSVQTLLASMTVELSQSPGYVYAEMDNQVKHNCSQCRLKEECQTHNGEDVCVIEECFDDVVAPESGMVSGNQRVLESRIKLECEQGLNLVTNKNILDSRGYKISECLNTGLWSVHSFVCAQGECSGSLVSGPNAIDDAMITASSTSQWPRHDPKNARLHKQESLNTAGGWVAGVNDLHQYIQAEFSTVKTVRAIQTQGRSSALTKEWVIGYTVLYSRADCTSVTVITYSDGKEKVFRGNADRNTVVTNYLPERVEAKCVRLHPVEWYYKISLRFEILGC